jgi:chromosome segregation ATPase
MAGKITLDEGKMLRELQSRLTGDYTARTVDFTKKRRELEQRLYALETKMEQLYEDKVSGAISADTFTGMAGTIERQRLEAETELSALSQTAEQAEAKHRDIDRWAQLIKEKSSLNEVDRELLESLIERIEVGEKAVVDGVKTQNVRIFYKYVGLC